MEEYDTVIIGGGAGGLTAGIYCARSGLRAIILDAGSSLAATSPWIENYPGFIGIEGSKLIEEMRKHAKEYLPVNLYEAVDLIEKKDGGFAVKTAKDTYKARSIIFATGAQHRQLGIPGEKEFHGKGVSSCATCDGFFFKGKKVVVVGGGNNAATEVIYLHNLGIEVVIIHRRGELRAEKALQEAIRDNGIQVIYNTVVEEIVGENMVTGIKMRNIVDGKVSEMPADGVFVSIGEIPNSGLAKSLGVETDEGGSIITDKAQRTNIARIYAAGDVTGGFRQVITACSEGAICANSAHEDLMRPYWVE